MACSPHIQKGSTRPVRQQGMTPRGEARDRRGGQQDEEEEREGDDQEDGGPYENRRKYVGGVPKHGSLKEIVIMGWA
ncbi:hypothetical protein MLD38_019753 [Melastoma candidum]|uniref:Uncharacterized protein n=1 Tax=Melastoma candidum TaxID=119954 RepID=A0ACB9QZV8_9MYRT|nr:hypothetical protein MLD38_019753 [Melastoma candidum]